MKNLKIILGLLVVGILVVVASGIVTAAANDQAGQRVYVLTGNSAAKAILGVNHEFPNGFSTEVSPQLKVLSALGLIKTEPVQLYHITARPDLCGNGELDPGEKCEEGVLNCPPGLICENCKCVEDTVVPPPPERACYPSDQTPWGIDRVYGDLTEPYTPSGGEDIIVAVLDTGVYRDHLDLEANVIDCKDTTRNGIKDGCADSNGHGTHVAGTILANGGDDEQGIFGVAPDAGLMAIKVCGRRGCFTDDIAKGIEYATDAGANIISMSLGGDTECPFMKDAIDYATGKGVLVVAAAGNDGPDDGSIDYPGANVNVIAVGAIDKLEGVPDFSSRGVNDGNYIIKEREVEFGAPGVAVESTYKDGCYAVMKGTSMATPHVAGLAAKLWDTDAATTRNYLHTVARDIWDEGDDTATGFGLPIAPTVE